MDDTKTDSLYEKVTKFLADMKKYEENKQREKKPIESSSTSEKADHAFRNKP